MTKLYLARAMSGREDSVVCTESCADRRFLRAAGFDVLDPVEEEGVQSTGSALQASVGDMTKYWPRDKQLIRQAHVFIDCRADLKSFGVEHEVGYARYFLYLPIIRVFPQGRMPAKGNVAYFEDDYVCDSMFDAVEYILRVHGTPWKRLKWRLKQLNRCLLKSIYYKSKEWLKCLAS